MKDGFIKVASASPILKVADCKRNTEIIIDTYKEAVEKGVKLVVFPELAVCGYTVGELVLQRALLKSAREAVLNIKNATKGNDTLVVVGFPYSMNGSVYNCAAVICNGSVLGIVPKTAVSCYGAIYDGRFFAPAPQKNCEVMLDGEIVTFGKKQIFSCEENSEFTVGVEIGNDLYLVNAPSNELALDGATVIACPSASSEIVGAVENRCKTVSVHSQKTVSTYILANSAMGESSAEGVFSGHSLIAENGSILAESKPFSPTLVTADTDVQLLTHDRQCTPFFAPTEGCETVYFNQKQITTALERKIPKNPFMPFDGEKKNERCRTVLEIQANALARRISHVNAKSIVVGISGGLDSCLALIVSVSAIDILKRSRKDILAVTMPCFGTTKRTKSNAEIMCEALGVSFKEISIKKAVAQHFEDIGQSDTNYDVAYENSQARERTQVLMDIANQNGGIVIGTGDLSELALGWATYNGDHMSMYGVNCDVPKTLVRHIVRFYADECGSETLKATLYDILDTPVSPELIPPKKDGNILQVTEDIVGPYELHDFFIYHFVRYGFTAEKIYRMAKYAFGGDYSDDEIKKWLGSFFRRFVTQQFKRSCSPDGVRVGRVSLAPSVWRMPSDAEYTEFKF